MCCCFSKKWIMPITLETDTEKNAESCTTFWNPYYEMKKKKQKQKWNQTKIYDANRWLRHRKEIKSSYYTV